jgi:hypothetical protein
MVKEKGSSEDQVAATNHFEEFYAHGELEREREKIYMYHCPPETKEGLYYTEREQFYSKSSMMTLSSHSLVATLGAYKSTICLPHNKMRD